MYIPQRILFQAIQSQIAVVFISFQNPAPFEKTGYSLTDLVEQMVELLYRWRRSTPKAVMTTDDSSAESASVSAYDWLAMPAQTLSKLAAIKFLRWVKRPFILQLQVLCNFMRSTLNLRSLQSLRLLT